MSQQGFCKRKGVGSWELGVGGRGWGGGEMGRWGEESLFFGDFKLLALYFATNLKHRYLVATELST
uniref:Uncharacterized protein n=1 Tax=Desertifilum tharense IPPAS B-1220 TaxID=1781255 RepID=A0A1E5QE30_9CYAN|nr:hypothetical protein BH720_24025 [Desertifilum tharense IPPAS B-1220]